MKFFSKFIETKWLDKDGNSVAHDSELADEMDGFLVEFEGEQQLIVENIVGVDWRDSPDEVIDDVNRVLAEKGLRFVEFADGSDSYHFFLQEVKS